MTTANKEEAGAGAGAGVRREEFVTADPEQAREFLGRAYGAWLLMDRPALWSSFLAVSHSETGSFAVSDVMLPADLTFALDSTDEVIITTVTEGTIEAEHGRVIDRYEPGDVLVSNAPRAAHVARTHRLRDRNVTVPVRHLYAAAGTQPGSPAPLRFQSFHPVTQGAQTLWSTTLRYVDGVLADPDAAAQPLLMSSVARTLAATVLAVFPNTLVSAPTSKDHQDAHRGTLRLAIAYIDEHACSDITVADIAEASHVTVRSIQLAFRRHLDTTPMAYLRQVRIKHAHAELAGADPVSTTVTAVAHRWGFANLGRFTTAYRQAYGILPSQTLRRG